ncbi:MAG: GDP-mannose 4,6-dehydratase [Lachnospiraceae bacterium]|nr:GDP-mannose 4,6-dehydratase [Lachnospiraceae bacterium]
MSKYLITGFSGFVSRHFLQFLYDEHSGDEVYGIDLRKPPFDYESYQDKLAIQFKETNLLDIDRLREVFLAFKPDYILHLASFSSVAYSWKYPAESFTNNTDIFLKLLTVTRECVPKCRILSVGSSEEYGNVSTEDLPIKETVQLKPTSPYAVARISQEMLAKIYAERFGMDIILTRSFNHIGIWQDDRFVVPSFVKRIENLKKRGLTRGTIETGDISIIRDFVDVRDVVRAYYYLLHDGIKGEVYNVCSGKGISLEQILNTIADEMGVVVDHVVNPDYVRPDDNAIIIGDYCKIKEELGWEPTIDFTNSIKDIINNRL